MPLEFRQLVKKQNTVVRQRDLTGTGKRPAADESRVAGAVMRRPQLGRIDQGTAIQEPDGAVNHRGLHGGAVRERRQQRRKPLGQHSLAGARRPDHQDMVPAGGGDEQRAFGRFLAEHVAHVGPVGAILTVRRACERLVACLDQDRVFGDLTAFRRAESGTQDVRQTPAAVHLESRHDQRLVKIVRRYYGARETSLSGVKKHR